MRNDGSAFETVLVPFQIGYTTAMVEKDDETVYILFDADAGIWREMTGQEQERELRAQSADMARIEREWRGYRNQGLGSAG